MQEDLIGGPARQENRAEVTSLRHNIQSRDCFSDFCECCGEGAATLSPSLRGNADVEVDGVSWTKWTSASTAVWRFFEMTFALDNTCTTDQEDERIMRAEKHRLRIIVVIAKVRAPLPPAHGFALRKY